MDFPSLRKYFLFTFAVFCQRFCDVLISPFFFFSVWRADGNRKLQVRPYPDSVNHPPILNTGNIGPRTYFFAETLGDLSLTAPFFFFTNFHSIPTFRVVQTQLGDWHCGICGYTNWRRRRVCQSCYPCTLLWHLVRACCFSF